MTTLAQAIERIYHRVGAPAASRANLDALADVLRDLSWRPPGVVLLRLPRGLDPVDRDRLTDALDVVARETADGDRPVRVRTD